MKPNAVVTRFAPSPTGLLHGGNYRTAVFAYLFAKKSGGEFIVRIEDTDRQRSKKEYEDNIHETLAWLGLLPDRVFRQSEHQARHAEEFKRLIESGAAYVSKEVPTEEGQRAEVIRFKNPGTVVTFTDVIRGDITVDTADLGDFIIGRSETEPLFHFAVVVDDFDEGVTHVVRGEDHISNTPRQILIQRALGYTTPTYAHLPLVLGPDRTKLSKRRGAKALTEYRDEGFVPSALINYLALLGWHPEDNKEIFTVKELIGVFTLERIQKSAGIFDETKLRWFNHEHLKTLSPQAYAAALEAFATQKGMEVPPYFSAVAPLLQPRVQTLLEAWGTLQSEEFDFFADHISYDPALLLQEATIEPSVAKQHLAAVERLLSAHTGTLTAETSKELIFPYATEQGRGKVLWPLRVALSGKEKSPDPFTLIHLLGKDTALTRIAAALAVL